MDKTRGGAWSEAAESYLDVLAVPLDPEGRRMTKVRAAELAGVSMSAVKCWRVAWPGFRAAEREAVAGRRQRNVEPLVRLFMNVLVTPAWRRLWRELNAEDGDVRLAWDVLQAAASLVGLFLRENSLQFKRFRQYFGTLSPLDNTIVL